MAPLLETGDLARTPIAAILLEALHQRATGVLTVRHGAGTSRLFLRDGVPVGAQAFGAFRPLGRELLASGRIDMDALEKSLAEMARTGRRQGDILVEMGAIGREDLERALAEQQAAYVAHIASLPCGTYGFDASAPVPAWTDAVRLSPLRLVVDALEKPQAEALVASALQLVSSRAVGLSSAYARSAAEFGWSDGESSLVARLAPGIAVDEFFADPPVAPERARAMLAALLLLGLAEPGSAETGMPPGLILELADVGGEPVAAPGRPSPEQDSRADPTPRAARETATLFPQPARRSDPDEARLRRQRLLARAMQNMGIGPASRPPLHPETHAAPTTGAAPSATDAELRRALENAAPRALERDLFARLGLPRTAGRDEVKHAYLQLAKQLHPDRFASAALADVAGKVKDLFSALNEAYEMLSDDARRAEYLARSGGPRGDDASAVAQARIEFQKGEACARTHDLARARAHYESAIRVDPRPAYEAALAWALINDPVARDRPRATALLERAMRDPTCDRAFHLAGVLAREKGDEARAERLLRTALGVNPRNAEAQRELRLLEQRRSARADERAPSKR